MEANLENIRKIYGRYYTSVKKYLTIDDILTLCTKDANLNIAEKELIFCFGMSKMAVTNELTSYKHYL